MNNRLPAIIAMCLLLFTGCASKPLVEPGQPSSIISDSSERKSASSADYFYLARVNENPVKENNVGGFKPTLFPWNREPREGASRAVPAGPQLLTIAGVLMRLNGFGVSYRGRNDPAVSGVIEVDLKPGQTYQVRGELDAFKREVWLVNAETQELVGRKIQIGRDESGKTINQADVLYTCCNLRYEEDWISDANWAGLPFIPAGARIVVKKYGSNRAYVNIEGRTFRIGLDYGREQDSIKSYLLKITSAESPQLKLKDYPAPVVAAIAQGRVTLGMTKEQAMIALGYPRADETSGLDANEWVYRTYDDVEYVLIWDESGHLTEVDTTRTVRRQVMVNE